MDRKKTSRTKAIIGCLLAVPGLLLIAIAGFLLFLMATEYQPADIEDTYVSRQATAPLPEGGTLRVVTWNVGFCALSAETDFFMDGGEMVKTATEARVRENIAAISDSITALSPDILLLQEVDTRSDRSYRINQAEAFASLFAADSSFAYNFHTAFLPYPIPPIGRVESGILTLSRFRTSDAPPTRISLPNAFSWPSRMVNLKRCLLATRIDLPQGNQLVLVNLHLEAYDDGEGKVLQTEAMQDFLIAEAHAGNYVIAGGDFNQTFSSIGADVYPVREDVWQPGEINVNGFSEYFRCYMDPSVPSCRSLDSVYADADPATFQYFLLDGFIISKELGVRTLETIDLNFQATDHNPVLIEVTLPAAGEALAH